MTENGEHGATAICSRSPSASAAAALGIRQDLVDRLHQRVRGQAALRRPEVHRAARRDEAQPQLARRLQLRLEDAAAAAREDVVVVEDGRAARERELRQAGARGGVLGFGVEPRPHRVQLDQPFEQRRVLRAGARERLVEVVVRVDEARCDERAAEVEPILARRLGASAHRRDEAVAHEHPAVGMLAAVSRPS